MTVANFDLNYLSYFLMNFKNSCAYLVANILNFSKLPQYLQLGWVAANKIAETKWELNYGTPCIYKQCTAKNIYSFEVSHNLIQSCKQSLMMFVRDHLNKLSPPEIVTLVKKLTSHRFLLNVWSKVSTCGYKESWPGPHRWLVCAGSPSGWAGWAPCPRTASTSRAPRRTPATRPPPRPPRPPPSTAPSQTQPPTGEHSTVFLSTRNKTIFK